MSRTVTAIYETREEAEHALRALEAEVSLANAMIYGSGSESFEGLRKLNLTPDERAACEGKLAPGEYMLLAQLRGGEDPKHVIAILENIAAYPPRSAANQAPLPTRGENEPVSPVIAEKRIPLVHEELRVGKREVARGGARVRTRVELSPVMDDVELLEEFVRTDMRPANRPVSAEELEQAGLLRERVIEIAEVREEAVVSKDVFVREEVVVTKTTERRIERINETVRRTEVDVQELDRDPAAAR